jgi:hypothetical protein
MLMELIWIGFAMDSMKDLILKIPMKKLAVDAARALPFNIFPQVN